MGQGETGICFGKEKRASSCDAEEIKGGEWKIGNRKETKGTQIISSYPWAQT